MAEATERPKLSVAPLPLLWTPIDCRLVDGAHEMLIEPLELFELVMAQKALVGLPIKRQLGSDVDNRVGRCGVPIWSAEETQWVCDDVGPIQVDGELVDLVAVHFRTACTRLEMTDKGRCRAKATVTLAPRTRYQGMLRRDVVSFDCFTIAESQVTYVAIAMLSAVMLYQCKRLVEIHVAPLAMTLLVTLRIVLIESACCTEVFVARIADVVFWRLRFVLP